MRLCARDIGIQAIQAAAVERSLEEDLAAERKALRAALVKSGGKSVREIAAGEAGCEQGFEGGRWNQVLWE